MDDTEYDFEYYGKSEALDSLESSYEYGDNPGFCKMQAKNLLKKVKRAIHELSDELEAVYSKYTDELVCVGRFSNGEAVYERANTLRGMLNAV